VAQSLLYHFNYSDDHAALIHDLQVNGQTIIDRIRFTGKITLNLPVFWFADNIRRGGCPWLNLSVSVESRI
jgi:hypothetical protein